MAWNHRALGKHGKTLVQVVIGRNLADQASESTYRIVVVLAESRVHGREAASRWVEANPTTRDAGGVQPEGIGLAEEERSGIRFPDVVHPAQVAAKLQGVRTFHFGEIFHPVVDGNIGVGRGAESGEIVQAAKIYVLRALQSGLVNTGANVAEVKSIDQSIAECGCVAHAEAFAVYVIRRGRRLSGKLRASISSN